jgi:group I intron endonuclease
MCIGIYKITSPKGKIYIGETVDIKRRFISYQGLSQSQKQPKLYNSFKKYGIKSHRFEVLEICSIEDLKNREGYYQRLYDSINKGLNCRETVDGNKYFHSEITKDKIRKSTKGTLGSTCLSKCIRVYMFNYNGKYVDDFFGIREAVRKTKISYRKINRSIKEGWDANGYFFSLKQARKIQLSEKKSRCIILIDSCNKEELYTSQKEVAQFLGVNKTNIMRCCNGDQFDVGSPKGRFRCKYTIMSEEVRVKWDNIESKNQEYTGASTPYERSYQIIKTKRVRAEKPTENIVLEFNSLKAAALAFDVTIGRISIVLKNPTHKAKGFKLSYF